MKSPKTRTRNLTSASDDELLTRAREGDSAAYGELWRRHAGAGKTIARRVSSPDLADDLVAEAFVRILSTIQRGSGPLSGFRPYLITTIRNVARRWAEKPQAVHVDDFDQFEDPETVDDPAIAALDRTLTLTAFRSLPERWQTVLWYSEVEGMDPHEIAPFLGMTPNATAALAYRARAGLREAWLQSHLNDDSSSPECRWTTSRLSGYVSNKLTARERQGVADHLATCTKCTIIAGELDHIGARLAFVLIPLLLGSSVGAAVLTSGAHGAGTAMASSPAPPLPQNFQPVSFSTRTVPRPSTSAVRAWAVAGVVTVAVVGTGIAALAVGLNQAPTTTSGVAAPVSSAPEASTSPQPSDSPSAAPSTTPPPTTPPVVAAPAAPPAPKPRPKPPVVPPPAVVDTVAPSAPVVTTPIDNSALQPFTIAGTGEPGATITVYDNDGTLLAAATADSSGNWTSGQLAGLLPTVSSLNVFQTDSAGNISPATPVGPIGMIPTISSPANGAQYTFATTVPVDLQGWPGTEVQLSLDGNVLSLPGQLVFDANGTLSLSLIGVPPGSHTIDVAYVANGQPSPAQAETTFTVTP